MSSRRLPVRFSLRARQDFVDILRFTGETWGPKQLLAYRNKIDKALQLIGRNPEIGHRTGDFPDEAQRLHLVGAHVVVYRVEATCIGVIRILHQRMLLGRHVPN